MIQLHSCEQGYFCVRPVEDESRYASSDGSNLDSQPHSHEPLEYDPGLETEDSDNGSSRSSYDESCHDDNDGEGQGGSYDGTPKQYNLSDLFYPPRPGRLPHGVWHREFIHYTGNRRLPKSGCFFLAGLYPRSRQSILPRRHVGAYEVSMDMC